MTKNNPVFTKETNKQYVLCLDTEDKSHGDPYLYCLYGEYQTKKGTVEHVDLTTNNKQEIINILNLKMKNTYLIGFNLGYDLNNLYPEFYREQHKRKGKFFGFTINKDSIKGMDISGLWFQGTNLKNLCEKFGFTEYIDQHKCTDRYIKQACRSHAIAAYKVTMAVEDTLNKLEWTMFYTSKFQPTASGMAYNVWKIMENQDEKTWDKSHNIGSKNTYHGGRCEDFIHGKIKVYYYDVCSMYPSVMKDHDYPNPNINFKDGDLEKYPLNYYLENYAGYAKGIIHIDEQMLIPPLAYIDQNSKKLIFPVGLWEDYLTFPEIQYLLELGGTFEPKSIIYTEKWQPFNSFIDTFYKLKNQNKYKEVAKLFLNGLSGKFGQHNEPEGEFKKMSFDMFDEVNKENEYGIKVWITNIPNDPDCFIYGHFDEPDEAYPHYPLISAYITAYSRIKLHKMMNLVGYQNVVYCDTDSLVTTVPIPVEYITTTKELGKWESKTNEPVWFEAIAPKKYKMLIKKGNSWVWEYKANGIPKRMQETFWKNPLEPVTYEIPLSFSQALRRKLNLPENQRSLNYWMTMNKQHVNDPKRIFNSDGTSLPVIKNDKLELQQAVLEIQNKRRAEQGLPPLTLKQPIISFQNETWNNQVET